MEKMDIKWEEEKPGEKIDIGGVEAWAQGQQTALENEKKEKGYAGFPARMKELLNKMLGI